MSHVARWPLALLCLLLAPASGHAERGLGRARTVDVVSSDHETDDAGLRRSIGRHLGRPYVWGSSGLKSYDCSGFVWRVMQENGILVKRTTARKFYLTLPKVSEEERWQFGNIIFFDHLKHCGIVDSREAFYHAAVTMGTHRAKLDPFWRPKVTGVRAMPRRMRSADPPPD